METITFNELAEELHKKGKSITTYARGHKIFLDYHTSDWLYADTKEKYDTNKPRKCKKCNKMPTPEGHDACLGTLPDIQYACCGHGVGGAYMVATRRYK